MVNKNFYSVVLHFGSSGLKDKTLTLYLPSCYCEPKIICAIVLSHDAIFATCEKYGCRKFNPWPSGRYRDFFCDYLIMLKTNSLDYGKII